MRSKVIVDIPGWNFSNSSVYAENLVRGLKAQGIDARILLTESGSLRIPTHQPARRIPPNLDIDRLSTSREDCWGRRWDALIRHLEQSAPCFYLMMHDWRNSMIAPRLSDRVKTIGIFHDEVGLELNMAQRHSRYLNGIVAANPAIHFTLASRMPDLAHRIMTILDGVEIQNNLPHKPLEGPIQISFQKDFTISELGGFNLINLADRLIEKNVSFQFNLFMDQFVFSRIGSRASELMTQGYLKLKDPQEQQLSSKHLGNQHIFISDRTLDGTIIELLEAMGSACVPLVTDITPHSQLIQNRANGLLIPVGRLDLMADLVEELTKDLTLRTALASSAYQSISNGDYSFDRMIQSYCKLFDRVEFLSGSQRFVRPREWVAPPSLELKTMSLSPAMTVSDTEYLNSTPLWPNATHGSRSISHNHTKKVIALQASLKSYKIIAAIPAGQISGVDVFTTHLVRELLHIGIDARILGERSLPDSLGMRIADDIPMDSRNQFEKLPWADRLQAMIEYLESQSPCIYIPNYDYEYSCVCPNLSEKVKVVAIAHSDDPLHYQHIHRIGTYSDAIIGVSEAITRHLSELDPTLLPRLHTIPYGIPLSSSQPVTEPRLNASLRIAFSGRLMRDQKRAFDIVGIAQTLVQMHVLFEMIVIGDGPDRQDMEQASANLIVQKRIIFKGKMENSEVLQILATCDAFLVTSAFDGLSVSLLEAMSRGLVPVVSDIRSGIPELIRDGENGLIAPVGDIQQFADHLAYLYQYPKQLQKMRHAAYQTILNGGFGLEEMTDRYMKVFQKVASQDFIRPSGPIVPPEHIQFMIAKEKRKKSLYRRFRRFIGGVLWRMGLRR